MLLSGLRERMRGGGGGGSSAEGPNGADLTPLSDSLNSPHAHQHLQHQPPTRPLGEIFFPESEVGQLTPSASLSNVIMYRREGHVAEAPVFCPSAPVVMTAQNLEYDRLAVLLFQALERRAHRRRIHEYFDTFYGKAAVDWLVGSGIFADAADARNALRHLLQRRLIRRADHTMPIFNDALERIAPEKAKDREIKYRNMHGSANRGFRDEHLYRFPSEAYCETEVTVKVCSARNLVYRSRPHLGPFALYSKFQQRKIDPYIALRYHTQDAKTDTCENSTGVVEWESEFAFYNEAKFDEDATRGPGPVHAAAEEEFRDLWVRVYDFHEVMDDLELGFCFISGKDIANHCYNGREKVGNVWRAWHPLRQSSGLGTNDRTYGEIELSISLRPFYAAHDEWTVLQTARPSSNPDRMEESQDARQSSAAAADGHSLPPSLFELVEDQVATVATSRSITQNVTDVLKRGVDEVVNLGNPGKPSTLDSAMIDVQKKAALQNTFTLSVLKCYIHRMSEMSANGEVWAEFMLSNRDGAPLRDFTTKAKSTRMIWPVRDMGACKLRGIAVSSLNEQRDVQVVIKVYQTKSGLTTKMGEASIALTKFLPDLDTPIPVGKEDEVDYVALARAEKVNLRRVAAFRRNRKILVGDLIIKAVIHPFMPEDEDGEEGESNAGDEASLDVDSEMMVLEDDLFNITQILSGKPLELPREPLPNVVFTDRVVNCSLEKLVWLVLSKNSPVLPAFCAKMKFGSLVQGDWRWDSKASSAGGGSRASVLGTSASATITTGSKRFLGAEDSGDDLLAAAGVTAAEPTSFTTGYHSEVNHGTTSVTTSPHHLESRAAPSASMDSMLGDGASSFREQAPESPNTTAVAEASAPPPLLKEGSMSQLGVLSKLPRAGSVDDDSDEGMPKRLVGASLASAHESMEDFPSRSITYTRPPETLVAALNVNETWRLKACSTDEGFWMEIEAHTNEPTFGNNMSMRINIVGQKRSESTCLLSISSDTIWNHRPAFAAALVERTANAGTNKTYEQYYKVIKAVLAKRRRGGAGGRAGEEEEEEEEEGEGVQRAEPAQWVWMMARYLLACIVMILFALALYVAYRHFYLKEDLDQVRVAMLAGGGWAV